MEANIKSITQGLTDSGGLSPQMAQYAKLAGMDPNNLSFEDSVFLQMMNYAQQKETEIGAKVSALDKEGESGGFYGGLTDPQAGGQTARALFVPPPPAAAYNRTGVVPPPAPAFATGQTATAYSTAANFVPPPPPAGAFVGGVVPAPPPAGTVRAAAVAAPSPAAVAGTSATSGAARNSLMSGVGQGLPGDPNKMSDTMKQQMLQKLMDDLKKMYELLSNIIKTMHDMQMTPIRNLKG
jgi:hypothetical protein